MLTLQRSIVDGVVTLFGTGATERVQLVLRFRGVFHFLQVRPTFFRPNKASTLLLQAWARVGNVKAKLSRFMQQKSVSYFLGINYKFNYKIRLDGHFVVLHIDISLQNQNPSVKNIANSIAQP